MEQADKIVMNVDRCQEIVDEMLWICIDLGSRNPLGSAKIMAEVHQRDGWVMEDGETLTEFNERVKDLIRIGSAPRLDTGE
jgi:hypothetical protein